MGANLFQQISLASYLNYFPSFVRLPVLIIAISDRNANTTAQISPDVHLPVSIECTVQLHFAHLDEETTRLLLIPKFRGSWGDCVGYQCMFNMTNNVIGGRILLSRDNQIVISNFKFTCRFISLNYFQIFNHFNAFLFRLLCYAKAMLILC